MAESTLLDPANQAPIKVLEGWDAPSCTDRVSARSVTCN